MQKYICIICGYIYNPETGCADQGVPAGVAWEDVREDYLCPLCDVGKDQFEPTD